MESRRSPIIAEHAAPDIMRQVQTIAGGLVLFGVLAGSLVSPWFYLIDAVVGAGLLTAGLTGFCGTWHDCWLKCHGTVK